MSRDDEELSFSDAMEELERILEGIENERVDIDVLGRELERAAELLELCRGKIRRAEVEVAQIVQSLDDGPGEEDSGEADSGEPDAEAGGGSEAEDADEEELPF